MAFKRGQTDSVGVPGDPEQLYRLLARGNRGPDSVWGHQSKVMEHWHREFRDKSDVALELPTGAGKTLVGGLIAEFLRRAEGRRVAYLCPTRQLAVQTARKLDDYGIPPSLLIGQSKDWDQADLTRFQAGRSIAVSTYSHVFNSRPRIDAADVLILDDAHAAESYVAKPWSLRISRRTHGSAYEDVLAALSPALDPLLLPHLRSENPGSQYLTGIYLASPRPSLPTPITWNWSSGKLLLTARSATTLCTPGSSSRLTWPTAWCTFRAARSSFVHLSLQRSSTTHSTVRSSAST